MKAYPHTKHFSDYHDNDNMNGMDLRDYFAAKAMQYWMSNPMSSMHIENMCKGAYQIADEMMKAREL